MYTYYTAGERGRVHGPRNIVTTHFLACENQKPNNNNTKTLASRVPAVINIYICMYLKIYVYIYHARCLRPKRINL